MRLPLIRNKWFAVLMHIAAWVILFIIPFYHISFDTGPHTFFLTRVYLRTVVYVIIFYINYLVLIPALLFKDKRVLYYLFVAAVIIGFYFINNAANQYLLGRPEFSAEREAFSRIAEEFKIPRNPGRFDVYNFMFTAILISGFSVGLRMLSRYYKNERQRKELEKEKLNSELAMLKNQVSPHFFFNTLNNIYSLVEINSSDAQDAILHLSKMMRYLLYESERGNTPLSREIEFMRNYIEIMKLKLNERVKLSVTFPDKYKDIQIPPLLFISFIENAFKHGISTSESSFITITMELKKNQLLFSCSNSMFNNTRSELPDKSGIGMENIKKRLYLLFPGRHQLFIDRKPDSFEIVLKIELS